MDNIYDIIHLFLKTETLQLDEKDVSLVAFATSSHLEIPTTSELSNMLSAFPKRDNVFLYISIDEGEASTCNSNSDQDAISSFLNELNDKKQVSEEDSQFEVKLSIDKVADHDGISVYSLVNFLNFLSSLDLLGVLHVMVRLFSISDTITFDCLENINSFHTQSIRFCHRDSDPSYCATLTSERKVGLRVYQTDTCHFINASEYRFVPDDFFLVERSVQFQQLNELFDKLAFIFCIIFIFDVTGIDDSNSLSFKLNGYRTIRSSLDFSTITILPEVIDDYFSLYRWIYNEGNLNDKLGLARNIISLQIVDNNPIHISGSVSKSTLSSYEIYLKDNIKQYIEVKNKMAEFLIQSSKDASKIVDDLAKSYMNSFFAFSSFFASVIILRLLSKGELTEVLTKDVTYLSLGILLISFVILLSSTFEVLQGKGRFVTNYNSLKRRYADILNKDDIDNIFNHDTDFKRDCSFINKRIFIYFCIWFFSIVLFAGIITYLGKAHLTTSLSSPHSEKQKVIIHPNSVYLDSSSSVLTKSPLCERNRLNQELLG